MPQLKATMRLIQHAESGLSLPGGLRVMLAKEAQRELAILAVETRSQIEVFQKMLWCVVRSAGGELTVPADVVEELGPMSVLEKDDGPDGAIVLRAMLREAPTEPLQVAPLEEAPVPVVDACPSHGQELPVDSAHGENREVAACAEDDPGQDVCPAHRDDECGPGEGDGLGGRDG